MLGRAAPILPRRTDLPGAGLSAPAGTPAPIIERLNREVLGLLQTAEIRNRFAELGGTPGTYSAADYNSFIIREVAKWAPLVQAAGATAD